MTHKQILETYFKQTEQFSDKVGTYRIYDNGTNNFRFMCYCGLAYWGGWQGIDDHLNEAHIVEHMLTGPVYPR